MRSRSAVLLATSFGASALLFACGGNDNGNGLDTSGADSPAQLSVQSDAAKAASMIAVGVGAAFLIGVVAVAIWILRQ